MSEESDSLVDTLIDAAKGSPLVFEAWLCECGVEAFCFHKFMEVISCYACGKRVASKVPLYRLTIEKLADDNE